MSRLSRVGYRHTASGIARVRWGILALSAALLGLACASLAAPADPPVGQTALPAQVSETEETDSSALTGEGRANGPVSPVLSHLNPAGPKNFDRTEFLQLIPRDVIKPVYTPEYRTARQVALAPNDLVIGLSIVGDHRAYPLKTLEHSEMVNDVLGGSPILVSW